MAEMRYEDYNGSMNRQKDIVLAPNEYTFVLSKTNGVIKTHTGPMTMTISAQESLVVFDPKTKQFIEVADIDKAKRLFTSAPEGWYIVLKNPAKDNMHPDSGKANNSPDLEVGKKINIAGPCTFSLFPGQMAKVVQGHRLRSNQYLLARVYDADAAKKNIDTATIVDTEGNEVKDKKATEYFMGQLLVIKGTEVSFYVPPTGIEVIPLGGKGGDYVRDAVTLERLEYAILKDEDGEKRYVHGPAVVFPKPTEVFVETPKGGNIFRALELSPISGIYIKVIAAYKDDSGVDHPIGEELFITGKEQMIYYPRPEHAMIQYDGKYMHHAIAIPEGEGRYILNRLTGEIKTIIGPQMYLPDPRKEVVVKRKLTAKECGLIYPGNKEVLEYNDALNEQATQRLVQKGLTATDSLTNAINCAYSTVNQESTLAIFEANANISRGSSYTKPRTITLDTKYEGVVAVNVWTGYAINVVAKSGKREVVVGPTTRLLNYDETLEPVILSTGCPKKTDSTITTAYLRIENNKVSDYIRVQTKDYVDIDIKVSYCVNFLEEYKDKWFCVENYVKYITDRMRSMLKREVKKYDVHEFYANSTDIVRSVVLGKVSGNGKGEDKKKYDGRLFKENGMLVYDVEVLKIDVDSDIAEMLEAHQREMIEKAMLLNDAEAKIKLVEAIAEADQKEAEVAKAKRLHSIETKNIIETEEFAKAQALEAKKRAAAQAKAEAELALQDILNKIEEEKLARDKAANDAKVALQKELEAIEAAKQKAYADTIKEIMASVSPDLVAALSTKANAELLTEATKNLSPLAIARGESVADTVNTLMRGTSLEGILKDIVEKKN
jgi:major vault protein